MTKRLGPRFGLEAGLLIGVAVVLGLLEVSWPAIAASMAIAWLLVAGVEIALSRRPAPAEPNVFTPPLEPVQPSPVTAPPPPPPVVEAEPEPRPEPEPEPEPEPAPLPATGHEWNLWELERIARDHAGADPARDEERSFLLLSLRDHARPDGNLPAEFDQLVRDAFGDVLRTPA